MLRTFWLMWNDEVFGTRWRADFLGHDRGRIRQRPSESLFFFWYKLNLRKLSRPRLVSGVIEENDVIVLAGHCQRARLGFY
jgi:hypothetical protein